MLSGGSLTTNNDYLSITSSAKTGNLNINTRIIDSNSGRIGVRVIGRGSNTDKTSEVLLNSAGGYTGDTIVEKGGRLIVLNGNSESRRFTVNNGKLFSDASGNFRPDTSIHLTKSGEFNFALSSAIQKLASLNVSGSGVLGFGIKSETIWASTNTYRHLFLDDLVINSGSELIIKNWKEGEHRLFVRKNSAHLKKSLGRIKYDENSQWRAQVRDYDKDYWEIYAPEASTYGAVFAVLGLLVVAVRKGRRFGG